MKKLRNILVVTLIIGLYACNNKEIKETVQLPELNQMSDLIITAKISDISNGFTISGQCNYPEGTKLSFTTYKDLEVSAQAESTVKKGIFEVEFGSKVLSSDALETTCIMNSFWQSEDVLNKLIVLDSINDEIVTNFSLNVMKERYFAKILKLELPFSPVLNSIESVKNFPFMGNKRINMNLIVDKDLSDQELETELKYKILTVLLKESDAKAVIVRCFKPNEDLMFKKALFSPNGSWGELENKPYSEYSLLIQ